MKNLTTASATISAAAMLMAGTVFADYPSRNIQGTIQ